MHDMFDLNRDGKISAYEKMLECDFIDSHNGDDGQYSGGYRWSGNSKGAASWVMFFLAIFFV